MYEASVLQKIKENVQPENNCLIWNRARSNSGTRAGYGAMQIDGKSKRVSRVVMEFHLKRFLLPTEYVLHHCDNPPCVKLDHLFLGNQKDNMLDMKNKNRERKARGENHPRTRLTEKDVVDIKRRRRAGESGYSLDREYGMALGFTAKVMGRFTWAWID